MFKIVLLPSFSTSLIGNCSGMYPDQVEISKESAVDYMSEYLCGDTFA